MSETNPYAPPQAPVDDVVHGRSSIAEFERFSTWGVFFLTIVTLTIYLIYWLYTRTRVLNRIVPTDPIPPMLINIAIGSFIINILMSILQGLNPGALGIALLSNLSGIVSWVAMLVWIFKFRSRLNTLVDAQPGDPLRLGPVMTFFFHVLYLQYKINQAIDSQPAVALRPA